MYKDTLFFTPLGYDTLTLWIEGQDMTKARKVSLMSKEHIDLVTGEIVSEGKYENLTLRFRSEGVSINGSLSKCILGNNLSGLSLIETGQAFGLLSDTLGLDIDQALVRRFDISSNLEMTEPVSSYLVNFGQAKYYPPPIRYTDSVLYKNSLRAKKIYDKLEEAITKRFKVPERLIGRFILRLELSYQHKIAYQFNVNELRASRLYEPDFCEVVKDRYLKEYFAINKLKISGGEINMTGVKEMIESMALEYMKMSGGHDSILRLIKDAQHTGKVKKQQAYNMRLKIKELTRAKPKELPDLIQELDNKVRQVVEMS